MTAVFALLIVQLYDIQIVRAHEFQVQQRRIITNRRAISAPRGEIFDRNGHPLAINHSTVMVKFDPSVRAHGTNDAAINAMMTNFVKLMNSFGELLVDDLPISDTEPREFLFNNSPTRERNWKNDMDLPQETTAQEAYDSLIGRFRIDRNSLNDAEIRLVLSLRQNMYMQRWRRNPFTVILQVSPAAKAALEERNQEFPGFFIDIDYLREYPEGKYVSHIIGYIRAISGTQLERLREFGYTEDFIVGHDGIESAFELQLQGTRGSIITETDSTGRRLRVEDYTPAVAGNNVYLTIDINLQRQIFHIVERQLTEIIIGKLNSSRAEDHINMRTFLSSMVRANSVSVSQIMAAEEEDYAWAIKQFVLREIQITNEAGTEERSAHDIIIDGVTNGRITENQFLLALYEQDIIFPTATELDRLRRGALNRQQTLNLIERMLLEGFITPAQTAVHPNTASVVMVEVNTGAVLASVSYPSYDNNRFVNTFDNAYWNRLTNDVNRPMFNRPFHEQRAPGSTFKMITAAAGLEYNVISPSTRIFDNFTFTKAGLPHARCNARHSHVNAEQAIMVSCNYYFYEVAHRLGNSADGTMLQGISRLNEYMLYFGLGAPTGVEISDVYVRLNAGLPDGVYPISSPGYNAHRNQNRRSTGWSGGDTIRTAIGQHENEVTAAIMAKYTATLASGGIRYRMSFLSHITKYDGNIITRREPEVEVIVPMSQSTINIIHRGMLGCTSTSGGTALSIFRGLPVRVAGKTGTAQEALWPNHSSFSAFAPYDNPDVALYVLMPGSIQSIVRAPAAVVAREIFEVYFRLNSQPQRPLGFISLVLN